MSVFEVDAPTLLHVLHKIPKDPLWNQSPLSCNYTVEVQVTCWCETRVATPPRRLHNLTALSLRDLTLGVNHLTHQHLLTLTSTQWKVFCEHKGL